MASEEQAVENSGIQLDAPILFFFKINSTNLVDKQQLVNIGEIAGAVKENNLSVKIIGVLQIQDWHTEAQQSTQREACKVYCQATL